MISEIIYEATQHERIASILDDLAAQSYLACIYRNLFIKACNEARQNEERLHEMASKINDLTNKIK